MKFTMALNQHDASAITPYLAPDADVVTPDGKEEVEGREAIESMVQKKTDKDGTCKLDLRVTRVRDFGDIALVDLDGSVTGPSADSQRRSSEMTPSTTTTSAGETPTSR